MPMAAQLVTYLNPLRYFMIVLQDLFLKGAGLDVLWPQFAAMAILGISLLILSVLRFHKRLA
jgi:drug efflux transport system permease protein